MTKRIKFQAPTGMNDILAEEQEHFQKIYDTCESVAGFYGFKRIDTPILEELEIFSKGTGLTSEIVQKQMFSLKTKGGDVLALRPEFTPAVARAYIEHGMKSLPQPVKLYSLGPLFRYEHPQAGRYRQFHGFNLEAIGDGNAIVDAQIIQIVYHILNDLKIKNLSIEINSIGDSQCRPYYKKLLVNYFRSRESSLCADCRRRLRENPLRIMDCKEEKCQRIVSQAPQSIDHLCEECHKHFKEILEYLDEIEVPYNLNPHLVRGLDYYTKTVFEIFADRPAEEKGGLGKIALAGGGRYDALIKLLGGEDTKAVGCGIGIERAAALIKLKTENVPEASSIKIFLAQLGSAGRRKCLKLMEDFRKVKIPAAESFGKDSLKAQLKMADKLGAKYTLLLGQKEALEGTIIVRDMENGRQETIKLDKAVKEMQRRLKR